MAVGNSTVTINNDHDFPIAAGLLAGGHVTAATQYASAQTTAASTLANAQTTAATTYADAYEAANQFSWGQQVLIPGLQAAANILILEYQKEAYEEIEERRIDYIDAAVEAYCECMEDLMADLEDATDSIPEPAIYQPFSPAGEQQDTICDNIDRVPSATAYVKMINNNHLEADMARAVALNPNYYCLNEITWNTIEDLMKGDLPIGLTVETLTKSAEESATNGRLGRACGQFRRNIGLVDYRVQRAARAERREELQFANQNISSLQRQGDIREMMVTPQQRFGYALQQAQLIQNSLQNAYNACAKAAPYKMQEIQIKLQKCTQQMQLLAGKAGLVSGYVPNYAGVLNSQVRDLASGLVGGVSSLLGGGATTNGGSPGGIGGIGGGSYSPPDGGWYVNNQFGKTGGYYGGAYGAF